MSDYEKNIILQQRETMLSTVQECINEKLDPRKVNILNQRKSDYKEVPSIAVLLGTTEDECYDALPVSSDKYFQVHLKCEPNACFINTYFTEGLIA